MKRYKWILCKAGTLNYSISMLSTLKHRPQQTKYTFPGRQWISNNVYWIPIWKYTKKLLIYCLAEDFIINIFNCQDNSCILDLSFKCNTMNCCLQFPLQPQQPICSIEPCCNKCTSSMYQPIFQLSSKVLPWAMIWAWMAWLAQLPTCYRVCMLWRQVDVEKWEFCRT